MTTIPSETLAQLTNAAPFQAEILAVIVQESTNLLAAHGFTNRTSIITNHYVVSFRDPDGHDRVVRGLNATSGELSLIKRLEKGNVYTFPSALLK